VWVAVQFDPVVAEPKKDFSRGARNDNLKYFVISNPSIALRINFVRDLDPNCITTAVCG